MTSLGEIYSDELARPEGAVLGYICDSFVHYFLGPIIGKVINIKEHSLEFISKTPTK